VPVRRLLTVRARLLLALLLAGLAVAATAVAGRGTSTATSPDLAHLDGVEFFTICRFSHRRPDDPIVHPRHPDRSHDHTFFGNVSTDAFSTVASLRGEPTTCQRSEDAAAYWSPTLLVGGRPVEPIRATVYYRRRTLGRVRAFPPGLVMIGGDAGAAAPQSLRVTSWDCGEHVNVPASSSPPACPEGGSATLNLNVRFPDCWDGARLDSGDHKQHMRYSLRGACPRSHRVAVPSLELVVEYAVPSGGQRIGLASGGVHTGHADFMNAWDQATLERLVAVCLNALRHCERAA
jgi:hypothetical protein